MSSCRHSRQRLQSVTAREALVARQMTEGERSDAGNLKRRAALNDCHTVGLEHVHADRVDAKPFSGNVIPKNRRPIIFVPLRFPQSDRQYVALTGLELMRGAGVDEDAIRPRVTPIADPDTLRQAFRADSALGARGAFIDGPHAAIDVVVTRVHGSGAQLGHRDRGMVAGRRIAFRDLGCSLARECRHKQGGAKATEECHDSVLPKLPFDNPCTNEAVTSSACETAHLSDISASGVADEADGADAARINQRTKFQIAGQGVLAEK